MTTTEEPKPASEFATEFVERLRSKAPGPEDSLPAPPSEFEQRWEREIPWRFRGVRSDQITPDVIEELVAWMDRGGIPTANLVLVGPVGTGKTHTGIAALRMIAVSTLASFAFFPVVELLDRLRPSTPEHDTAIVERCCTVRVLMLDDLGAEKASDWTVERLYAIVNRRWLEGRPTIVTTNLPAEDLEKALDPRLYSRLVDGAVALRLTGKDRRRT